MLGDRINQALSLYRQVEALTSLCRLDHRKYEPQLLAAQQDLMQLVQALDDAGNMFTLLQSFVLLDRINRK